MEVLHVFFSYPSDYLDDMSPTTYKTNTGEGRLGERWKRLGGTGTYDWIQL